MIFYVTVGGMKGTTYVQIVKAVLLMLGSVADRGPGAREVRLQPLRRCSARPPSNSGKGDAFLQPGLQYGSTLTSQIDFLSLGLALVLGTAGLPHILIRFYTVPTARPHASRCCGRSA